MLKIVESIYSRFVRLPIKPGIKLVPGQLVKTANYKDYTVIDVSDGYNVFGICSNRVYSENIEVDYKCLAKVYCQKSIVHTDNFDRNCKLSIGCSLYSNQHGMLTSNKLYNNFIIIGKLISLFDINRKYIEFIFL